MNKWLKYVKPEEEKEKPEEIQLPNIISAEIYSYPHLKKIYFTEDDYFHTPIAKHIPVDNSNAGWDIYPEAPLRKYADERRNQLLNSEWNSYSTSGVLEALKHEEAFRLHKVKLKVALPGFAISLSPGTPGIMYHNSFIDLFPEKIKAEIAPKLKEGCAFVMMKKLPWVVKKDNLEIQLPKNNDLSLFDAVLKDEKYDPTDK